MTSEPRASRPHLPPGYGAEKATGSPGEHPSWERVGERLAAARNYWVCTMRPNGRPHAKPVWGLWLENTFIFSTHPETVTARNLRTSSAVSVHPEGEDPVLTLEGETRRTHDRTFLARFGRTYGAKYEWPMGPDDVDPENPNAAFYVVRPRRVVAWSTDAEVGETITRWTFP